MSILKIPNKVTYFYLFGLARSAAPQVNLNVAIE